MREIKFRAWSKFSETMYEVREIRFNRETVLLRKDGFSLEKDFDNAELMQFTGLRDKNGKEVFEGDIVEYEHEGYKILYIVEWSEEGYFSIKKVSDKDWEDYIFCRDLKNFEILGNIYENPELLEVGE